MKLAEKEPGGEEPGRLELVRHLVDKFGEQAQERAATVADFVRLLGLERDFSDEQGVLREIEVRWVAETKTESDQ